MELTLGVLMIGSCFLIGMIMVKWQILLLLRLEVKYC